MFKSAYDRTFLSKVVNVLYYVKSSITANVQTYIKERKLICDVQKRIIFSALSKIIVWRK